MIVEDGKIIEATERELYNRWLDDGWDNICTFPDYFRAMKNVGVKIVKESNDGNQRTTH